MPKLPSFLGRILCWLGVHDVRIIEKTFGFGDNDGVEKVECRRCGIKWARRQ